MIQRHKVFALLPLLGIVALGSVACARALALPSAVQDEDDSALAGERGVPISGSAPSFMPLHVTGPNAGTKACPLCIYGLVPQFQLWVEEAKLPTVLRLAKQLEDEAVKAAGAKEESGAFVPYLVLIPSSPNGLSSKSRQLLGSLNLKRTFVTQIPRWDDPETGGLYGHSMKDRPGVRGYLVVNRRVFARWEKPNERTWTEIGSALAKGRPHVTTHEFSDSQIAPTWEPGRRLSVRFRVVDAAGKLLRNVKVSAYQTDVAGLYNPPNWNRRAPRLTTNAWTADDGWITFDTIMPGPYPNGVEPAHIHFTAVIDGKNQYRTLWFEGDPLLTDERRRWADGDAETLVIPLDRTAERWKAEHTFFVSSA